MFLAPALFFLAYGLLGVYSWTWYVYLFGLAGVTGVLQAVLRWARRPTCCCSHHHTNCLPPPTLPSLFIPDCTSQATPARRCQ